VIPVGSYKEEMSAAQRKESPEKQTIDILFPMAMSMSFFLEGFRIRTNQLYQYQKQLTEFLDNLPDVAVRIKPVPNHDENSCATVQQFKRLKRAQVLSGMTLRECLKSFRINAVLLEYPSTTLFEVLGEDLEIFLLCDPVLPFSPEALDLLKKRVHYFETTADVIEAIRKWVTGDLPKKRDTAFMEKYVSKPDTRQNILKHIRALAA
jgi:hypothetical protein